MRATDCLVHRHCPGITVFHEMLAEGVCVDTSTFLQGGTNRRYWETAVIGPGGEALVDQDEWTVTFEESDAGLQHGSMVAEVWRRVLRVRVAWRREELAAAKARSAA